MCMGLKGWLIPGSDPKARKYFLGIPRNLKEGVTGGASEIVSDYKKATALPKPTSSGYTDAYTTRINAMFKDKGDRG